MAFLALVTRPGDAGQRLSAELRDRGQRALWWPTFDLLPPADPELLQSLLRKLAQFELVIFVSPAAVRGLAALDPDLRWPAGTAVAAAGPSTLALVRSLLGGASAARTAGLADGAPESGSESLWGALRQQGPLPGYVLIVRAESGREWLGERLREAGCRVEYASVYRRVVHRPAPAQMAALTARQQAGDRALPVLTSSESVAALDRQLEHAGELRGWLRQGLALASHPRIEQAARAAGYAQVAACAPSSASVLAAADAAPTGWAGAKA